MEKGPCKIGHYCNTIIGMNSLPGLILDVLSLVHPHENSDRASCESVEDDLA